MTHLIVQLALKRCWVLQVKVHAVWWGAVALAAEEPCKGVVVVSGSRVALDQLAGWGVLRGSRGRYKQRDGVYCGGEGGAVQSEEVRMGQMGTTARKTKL